MHPIVPFLLIAGVAGIAYLSTIKNVVDAAMKLRFQLTRIQIYRLKLNEPIIFRVWVEFTNLDNVSIVIQQLYLDIFLNFGTAQNPDKTRIATAHPQDPLVIAAHKTEEIYLDVQVRWVNLAANAVKAFQGLITGDGVKMPTSAIVEGQIKAEHFTIPIEYEVPFVSEPIENKA